MLYIFCGDRYSAREHARAFADACKKKRENAEYIYFSPAVTHQSLEELLFGQGLFEKKYIVFCDEILANPVSEHLLRNIAAYHASPHMFVVFEPSLEAKQEREFTKHDAVVKRYKEQASQEDTRALFGFTDVFMRGDRNKTFAALHRLLLRGESPSSLLNILLWQLRMLVLTSRSNSATEAGVKPFVYTKAKRALDTFGDPFTTFLNAEQVIRKGRLQGATDAEIIEYIVLTSQPAPARA